MALTGSVRDFGISEILQMIGHQKKSGVLLVEDKSRKVEILIDQGNIVLARHDPFKESFDLATMLARSGMIPEEKMNAARKEAQHSLKPLEQVLLNSGEIEIDELTRMVTLANLETIYSLFLWTEGNYSFESGPVTYPQQWTTPIASEQVLMDGYRIKDEWPLIEKAIPNPLTALAKVPGEFGPESRLSEESNQVYRLINGSRSADDVVFLTRMGRFETLKILKELIEEGRVKLVAAESEEKQRDMVALAMTAASVIIIIVGLAALGTGSYRMLERTFHPDIEEPGNAAVETLWTLYKKDVVGEALSEYAAERGFYPETLQRLVEEGKISEKDVKTAWGDMEYEVDEDGKRARLIAPIPEGERKSEPE